MLDGDKLTFTDMEQSLDKTLTGILSEQKEEDFKPPSKSQQDSNNLLQKFNLRTPDGSSGMRECGAQGENLPPIHANLTRTASGSPIRRSLVGSFEESLLSGRLLCGKFSQRIDGFLAVLNVTGGNFSPQSQKIPFAVSSVDGDKYLL